MAGFAIEAGHRIFDDSCEHAGHQPGDRHRTPGLLDQEWTGSVWAPVCPDDDVPMCGRDSAGWLTCQDCGATYRELAEQVRP